MHSGWAKFWRETAKRAPFGLIVFPAALSICFCALAVANGEVLSLALIAEQVASTFLISWSVFAAVVIGMALQYKFGLFGPGSPKTLAHFLAMGCFAMAGLSVGLVLAGVVLQSCCQIPFSPSTGYFAGSLFTGGLITVSFIFHLAYRASRRRISELERATAESRYETLKAQMQPHFLFNSLNSLSELIDAAVPEAATMTARLADLYRHILENSKEKTATLASELRIIRDYLELERLRFGKRLQYTVHCEVDDQRVFVPSLILQTLVENAVKHGISPSLDGGTIAIRAIRQGPMNTLIEVKNSGISLKKDRVATDKKSSGTGLANTRERLRLMYGDAHDFYFGLNDHGLTIVRFTVTGERLV